MRKSDNLLNNVQTNKHWSSKILGEYHDSIIKIVESYYGINYNMIKSKDRTADLVLIRRVLAALLVNKYKLHVTSLALWLKKDRTTIIFYCKSHEDGMKFDKRYELLYEDMEKLIDVILDSENIAELHTTEINMLTTMKETNKLRREKL